MHTKEELFIKTAKKKTLPLWYLMYRGQYRNDSTCSSKKLLDQVFSQCGSSRRTLGWIPKRVKLQKCQFCCIRWSRKWLYRIFHYGSVQASRLGRAQAVSMTDWSGSWKWDGYFVVFGMNWLYETRLRSKWSYFCLVRIVHVSLVLFGSFCTNLPLAASSDGNSIIWSNRFT